MAAGNCTCSNSVLTLLSRWVRSISVCRVSGSAIDWPIGHRGFSEDPGSWKTTPTLLRISRSCLRLAVEISFPATQIVPDATFSRPTAARPIVDFPDPDSPTRPTTSPLPMVNDTSSTARKLPLLPGYSMTACSTLSARSVGGGLLWSRPCKVAPRCGTEASSCRVYGC
ncbi:Uncharacterised protein [Mycobacteroides abscessus subsp. abscessus]|nr:Uncharacterised protein [Mycobacteroides abscessus subsp. abscessus]